MQSVALAGRRWEPVGGRCGGAWSEQAGCGLVREMQHLKGFTEYVASKEKLRTLAASLSCKKPKLAKKSIIG